MKPRPNINRARVLRKNANAPEQVAGETLRMFRRFGYPVRRQHQIGRFVVDFAIVKERLIIEIDGGIHDLLSAAERDALREKEITANGWRVLRVPAQTAMSKDHLFALMQKELGL
jgi:very-short-patch-repair endonuclease